jgi:hypothetical protein
MQSTVKCPRCSKTVPNSASFCRRCGHALGKECDLEAPQLPARALIEPAPLDYLRPRVRPEGSRWVTIARFPSTAQWHQAKAALSRGRIESLMSDGEDIDPGAAHADAAGLALKVPKGDAERARKILDAVKHGADWCPRCGSTFLEELPLPWWWMIWSILFLGIAPFEPNRFVCRNCQHRW